MANFVRHEPCPSCGSRNNVARYDDGSSWCFGCHRTERRDRVSNTLVVEKEENVQLSDDLCFDYPGHVVAWLAKYGLAPADGIKYGWKYSPHWDQLVFLFKDKDGTIACSQARNFSPNATRKYYNQGTPSSVLPIFREVPGPEQVSKRLVVVEDAVSAARVGSTSPSMPCLGSHLPSHKLVALKGLGFNELVVWLDSDKLKESREIAQRAKWLGFSSRVVYTELDPKCYSNSEIKIFLDK